METEKKYWFRAKKYGLGWRPVSWQGWLVTLIYVAGLIHYAVLAKHTHSISDFLLNFAFDFVILTGFFLAICYYTGEKLGWHWGEKNVPEDKNTAQAEQ